LSKKDKKIVFEKFIAERFSRVKIMSKLNDNTIGRWKISYLTANINKKFYFATDVWAENVKVFKRGEFGSLNIQVNLVFVKT